MDEQLLAKTFVELADNLVADFDLIDFLRLLTDRCVGVLGVSAAGVLLADRNGELRVMAASSEQARLLELFQLQNDEGPCLECYRTGTAVTVPDLAAEARRWPQFVAQAQLRGFTAVQALPMRLREDVVGALNLFSTAPGLFDPAAIPLGQALADVAAISLLQQRSTQVSTLLNEQLQTALNSRVVIEQAKGKLAERLDIDMEQAFTALRGYARAHQQRLSDVALAFVNGTEPLTDLGR
jgi:transcriptional regulator with GAF, ATPase, and Fis domain